MANHKYDLKRQFKIIGQQFEPAYNSPVRPPVVDLRSQFPLCFDQGREGSCGPNSADAIMCFLYPQVAHTDGGFSRQQIYYNVRQLEGDVDKDSGVKTADLFNVLETNGAAPENLWPYTPANLLVAPPKTVIEAAAKYRIKSKSQLVTQDDFLNCLAEGFPFVLGIAVFQSLESKQLETTGVYARPNVLVEPLLGGHDVTVVGRILAELCKVRPVALDRIERRPGQARRAAGFSIDLHGRRRGEPLKELRCTFRVLGILVDAESQAVDVSEPPLRPGRRRQPITWP